MKYENSKILLPTIVALREQRARFHGEVFFVDKKGAGGSCYQVYPPHLKKRLDPEIQPSPTAAMQR